MLPSISSLPQEQSLYQPSTAVLNLFQHPQKLLPLLPGPAKTVSQIEMLSTLDYTFYPDSGETILRYESEFFSGIFKVFLANFEKSNDKIRCLATVIRAFELRSSLKLNITTIPSWGLSAHSHRARYKTPASV